MAEALKPLNQHMWTTTVTKLSIIFIWMTTIVASSSSSTLMLNDDDQSSSETSFSINYLNKTTATASAPHHQRIPRVSNTEKIAMYSVLFVIASVGNTTSFVALLFMNRLNRSANFKRIRLLFMNLCIADLLVTYVHLPLEIIWAYTDAWLAGMFMCKLMMFIRTFGLYLSSFIIITITIDRYYVIVRPMELDRVFRLNKVSIIVSWIASFLSSLPQVYVFEVLKHPKDPTFEQCVTFGTLNNAYKKIIYNLYHFISCYGLPLAIMIYCYAEIFSTITTHSKDKQKFHDVLSYGLGQSSVKQKTKGNNRIRKFGSDPLVSVDPATHVSGAVANSVKSAEATNSKHRRVSSINVFKMTSAGTKSNSDEPSDELTAVVTNHKISLPLPSTDESRPEQDKLIPSMNNHQLIRRNTNKTYLKAKFRTFRLSALIVIAYIFSWTPYYVCVLWAILSPHSFQNERNKKISNYLFTFAVSNSCFNPIVYGIFSNKLYKFLPCIRNKKEYKINVPKSDHITPRRRTGSLVSSKQV